MNNLDFQEKIKYIFKNKELLETALTHSSYIKEKKFHSNNNERLEFLGDAFFDAIISEELYKRFPDVEEGSLSKLRAKIVCEKSLAKQAAALKLGEYILMGKGEEHSGGRQRDSIIADAMEAVIAAIFLDGGFEEAKKFVMLNFKVAIEDAVSGKIFIDYKTVIQEKLQEKGIIHLFYQLTDAKGPDHDKTFFISLIHNGKVIGKGQGKTKKTAEQNAAEHALESMGRGEEVVL